MSMLSLGGVEAGLKPIKAIVFFQVETNWFVKRPCASCLLCSEARNGGEGVGAFCLSRIDLWPRIGIRIPSYSSDEWDDDYDCIFNQNNWSINELIHNYDCV